MEALRIVFSCGFTTKDVVLVDVVTLNWGAPFEQGGAVNAAIKGSVCSAGVIISTASDQPG